MTLVFPLSASAIEKGVETDLTWGISGRDQDRTIAGVQDLGANWMRITLSWHDVETSDGTYSSHLARYDAAIDKAEAAGINLIVTVYTAPGWASGTTNRESPPLNPAHYADFMSFVADRYRGKVEAWEIWNEQNAKGFWSTGPNAAAYARLLKAAYPAVKSADPDALVLYGGTWENDYAFLEAAYDEVPDLGNYYDVMATHPYSGVAPPEQIWYDENGRIAKSAFAGYREIRNTMLAHGDDKPIWFTEFGWATFDGAWGVSEATQADYLQRAYRCAEQDSYVGVGIWYIYRNVPWGNDGQTWYYQLGLTRTDFSPKPAYNAFKSYTPGSGGCTYDVPAPPAPAPEPTPPPAEPAPVEPAPTEPPAPVEEPEPEPETVESSSVTQRSELRLRIVRIRGARARAASREVRIRRARRVAIVGRVKNAARGRVTVLVQRRTAKRGWRIKRDLSVRVTKEGRFDRTVRRLGKGRWRVRAVYRTRGGGQHSRSRLVYFRM